MRTTLNIDDDLYKKIKSKAALEGKKVTELIQEGLNLILNDENRKLASNKNKKTSSIPKLDRSNGRILFQGMTTKQYLAHIKKMDQFEK
jgi:hypothetical protein